MADNKNRENQSYNQDWDRNRNRFQEDDDYMQNRKGYGKSNAGYSGNQYRNMGGYEGSSQRDMDDQGGYGRQYGAGYRGEFDDQEQYRGGSGYYGQQGMSGSYGDSYDGRYEQRTGWNQHQGQRNRDQYSGHYGREDWGRGNVNSGYQDEDRSYRNRNYGSSAGYGQDPYNRDRTRNMYGGDTSNYGNANQGGFDRDWWDRTKDEVSSWFGDDDAERRRRMDKTVSHRGKGPKDYQRSQDRIREDVCDRLSDDERLDATNVQVQVQGNEVILTGTVNSREEKRRAEDLVESISGVQNVENRIRVGHRDETSTGGRTTGSETTGNERKNRG